MKPREQRLNFCYASKLHCRSLPFLSPYPPCSLGAAREFRVVALADGCLERSNLVVLLEGHGDLDRPRAVWEGMEEHFHLAPRGDGRCVGVVVLVSVISVVCYFLFSP